ncbi:MAG: 3-isopropylmalate dehydratase large subunit [Hyphomonas sp.]|uniref:3-isopropylmalate dehydratase large subunit n=1 Tax=Hyphomonas sp. TaxID=87 RepID=UPI001D3A372E|nr:3-isopropylmalate dehydratase large subunit [Hyphomonas sp.]MBA4225626.1 3-isopropylmalate dehydratase large subunit [Hyphomonas sp.]
MAALRTLYDKLVGSHTVRPLDADGRDMLLYVDRTVLNEYTSPQAFTGLREAGRPVFRPASALGVIDHVNSTRPEKIASPQAQADDLQMAYFVRNCRDFGIELFDLYHRQQGIEHVVMPELGLALPGLVIAAGDSHTTTYGAFGALGFGIGTSDIEHFLATQTVVYRRLRNMEIAVRGDLPAGVTAKDLIMAVIRQIGADGAQGHAVEFTGPAIRGLSIEGRMTVCNMAVECGARGALIAPDAKTYAYLEGKPRAPKGKQLTAALEDWRSLRTDAGAVFDARAEIDAGDIEPMVTWGTSPDQAAPISGAVPDPALEASPARRRDAERALGYMGLSPGTRLEDIRIDHAFIGSCTNARIEDLRAAGAVVKGRRVAPGVSAMVVPGSREVRRMAEAEGLDRVFREAGFEWREPGCSMCLAMNDDVIAPGKRCASSTNRNFEGRQGAGSRTHLMSPAMVAAAAVSGHLCDVRKLEVRDAR